MYYTAGHSLKNLRDAFIAMSSAIDVSSSTGFTLQFGFTLAACRCIKAGLPSQRCADTCSGENGQQSALCMQDSIYSINVSLKLMKILWLDDLCVQVSGERVAWLLSQLQRPQHSWLLH